MSVRPEVRTSVCPTHLQGSHMNHISLDGGRWDKSNDVTFKVIGGQGQGHGPLEVENMAIFQSYLLPWESG